MLCPERLYTGVVVAGLLDNPDADASFAQATGVSPSVGGSFTAFTEHFDTAGLRRLSDSGQLPMVTWEPWSHGGTNDTSFR